MNWKTENGGLPVIFVLTCDVSFFYERREGDRGRGERVQGVRKGEGVQGVRKGAGREMERG